MLIKDFYRIRSKENTGDGTLYSVSLNSAHEVYKGHFPDKPITPGVCNIQMIKELAEDAAGQKFALRNIDRCRLTAMVTPDGSPDLEVMIKIDKDNALSAEIFHGDVTYMTLSGKLTAQD